MKGFFPPGGANNRGNIEQQPFTNQNGGRERPRWVWMCYAEVHERLASWLIEINAGFWLDPWMQMSLLCQSRTFTSSHWCFAALEQKSSCSSSSEAQLLLTTAGAHLSHKHQFFFFRYLENKDQGNWFFLWISIKRFNRVTAAAGPSSVEKSALRRDVVYSD